MSYVVNILKPKHRLQTHEIHNHIQIAESFNRIQSILIVNKNKFFTCLAAQLTFNLIVVKFEVILHS
jgi:hypothetical protein